MSEINPGDNPEIFGSIHYKAADEAAATDFVTRVAELAASTSGAEVVYVEEAARSPRIHSPIGRHEPGLFTWAIDPATDRYIAVITRDNAGEFDDGSGDSPKARHNRSTRFFNSMINRSISDIDMDDGGYVLFAEPDEKSMATPGIRVIRSLELLRKLNHGQIGREKPDGSVGLRGLGETGIDFLRKYCTALFPRVDISQATRELDMDKMEKMLARSHRRFKLWNWVGMQAVGTTFKGSTASWKAGLLDDQQQLRGLEELGLIARFPQYPWTRIHKHMNYYGAPFVKLHDDRWEDLGGLLAKQGS